MTPLSALASFLQGFAAFLTIVAGYLLCLVVAVMLLIFAELVYEARRVREHAHRIN
jgi:hypothetical protein